jgi:hypothetical protein
MDVLSRLLTNITKLDRESILIQVYNDAFEKYAIDLNRIDQLFNTGEDSNENALPSYSANTVAIKARKGQPTDRTTLKDTGEFYNTFDLIFNTELDFEIIADDMGKELFDRYGKDIVGWNTENTNEIKEFIQKRFIEIAIKQVEKGL